MRHIFVFALSTATLIGIWYLNANFVNDAFDWNQELSKRLARWLDTSGKLYTGFRFVNVEKMFLFGELEIFWYLALFLLRRAIFGPRKRSAGVPAPTGPKPPPKH